MRNRLVLIVSCCLFLLCSLAFAQDSLDSRQAAAKDPARAYSSTFPVSISLPEGWQSFAGDPKVRGEILFLQSSKGDPMDATLSLATFDSPAVFKDLVRRQNFQLVVERDAAVLVDEALTLRGAKGHKWAYVAKSSGGEERLYYDLYLLLPKNLGGRLLTMHGLAKKSHSSEAIVLFNSLASSLSW